MVVLVASALAAQVSIDADTRSLQVGESTRLRVTVVGASPDYAPELPEVDGLRFTYVGSRPTRVTINFKTERLVTYTWQVTAEKPGRFTVGPVDISVRDETLQTEPLTFKVAERTEAKGMTSELVDEAWVGQVVVHQVGRAGDECLVGQSSQTRGASVALGGQEAALCTPEHRRGRLDAIEEALEDGGVGDARHRLLVK